MIARAIATDNRLRIFGMPGRSDVPRFQRPRLSLTRLKDDTSCSLTLAILHQTECDMDSLGIPGT